MQIDTVETNIYAKFNVNWQVSLQMAIFRLASSGKISGKLGAHEMQHWPAIFGNVSICSWHECRGCTTRDTFDEHFSRQWLQKLKMDPFAMATLRATVHTQEPSLDLTRMTDGDVIQQTAHLLKGNRLRKCGGYSIGPEGRQNTQDQKDRTVDAVIRVLTPDSKPIALVGRRFRLVAARNWRQTRENGRYEIASVGEARTIITTIMSTAELANAVRIAWQNALELLRAPEDHRFESGIFLLREIPRSTNAGSSDARANTSPDAAREPVDGDSKPRDFGDRRGLTTGGPVGEFGFSLVSLTSFQT